MATGTFTATVSATRGPDVTDRYFHYYGDLAVSAAGDTYTTGGAVCTIAGKKLIGRGVPTKVEIWDEKAAAQCAYQFVVGSNLTNGKIVIRGQQPTATPGKSGSVAFAEFGSGVAFNAANMGVSAATLKFKATFRK
jgi:hypothetical protein